MSLTLNQAIRLALSVGAAAAMSPSAFAQTAPAQNAGAASLEEVTVTGSHIRRVDVETASPVLVLDAAAISASGVNTIGDLVQRIPSIAGNAVNPQVNNGGGYGESNVELRGLGVNRTLVLLNGRRISLAGASGGVDVNMIPVAAIERVEVLKEGAGAVYGSDAIAGVVNFILKKGFEGVEVNGDYGRTSRKDGENHSESVLIGSTTDKFSFMSGGSYTKYDGVSAGNRDFSKVSLGYYSGSVVTGGSSRRPQGRIFLPAGNALRTTLGCSSVTRIDGAAGSSTLDYRCYNPAQDAFNFQPYNLLLTPQERGAAFTLLSYKFNDDVEAYAEMMFNRTHSGYQIAPLPFDTKADDVVISADSYYNPFGISFGGQGANTNATTRLLALGDRASDTTSDSKLINAGLRGKLPFSDWKFDFNVSYGRLDQAGSVGGYLFKPALAAAFGPSFLDPTTNTVTCGTLANPIALSSCTPVDFFNLSSPSQVAALKTISAGYNQYNTYVNKSMAFDTNGKLFDLPAGPVQAALGASYNSQAGAFGRDFLATASPPLYLTCQLAQETCGGSSAGHYSVKELYGEVQIPVLHDLPGVRSLDFNAGVRYSDYSTFGSTTKGQLRVEWRPVADLLVRGSYAQVFRSPTIADLYASPSNNSATFTDVCNGLTAAMVTANPNYALICQYVPTDGSYQSANSQATGLITGNSHLKPETGNVVTYGVVYDSSLIKGFSATIDVWRYKINNLITTLDPNFAATQCLATGSSEFCSLFTRFPVDGQIQVIQQPTFNLGELKTNGIDLSLKYTLPHTSIGGFTFAVDVTKISSYQNLPAPGAAVQEVAGTYDRQFGNYAKVRGTASIGWSYSSWDALLSARYIGKVDLLNYDGGTPVTGADPDLHVAAVTYVDLTVGYTFPTHTTVRLTGTNLNDKQPTVMYSNNVINANTDVSTYDLLGRRYLISFTQKF